jgi:hypothetical protein
MEQKPNPKSRCPNGTHRNKKTGNCDKNTTMKAKKFERCPKGTRRNKYTGECVKNIQENTLKKKTPVFDEKHQPGIKIKKFMLQNRQKIRALFLNTICTDSGSCIALGTNADKIKQFFGGFVDFTHLSSVRKIGKSSANGAICELKYENIGYTSHTILKMNAKARSDSLLYEYFVGVRINHFAKYFPNFLETYGSYTVDEKFWKDVMKNPTASMTKPRLFANFALNPPDIHDLANSCKPAYYKSYAIMIQHLKVGNNEETIGDCIQKYGFRRDDLASSLYQVYFTLSQLGDHYTHYDLHANNVMMYVPDPDGFIEYHYHHNDGTKTIFKSKYIVKIIDYGRNYIKVDGMPETSDTFYKDLCKTAKCNKPYPCGAKYGYTWLDPTSPHYIIASKPNISHDLRLIASIFTSIHSKLSIENPVLFNLLRNTQYEHVYGTKEIRMNGFPNAIHNVIDAELKLRDYLANNRIANDIAYLGKKKLGELHMYANMSRQMHFDSV